MRAFGVVMIAVLLAGCGQKGPLYMADDRPDAAQPLGGDAFGDGTDDSSQDDDDQE